MVAWVATPVAAHYAAHGVVNGWHFCLAVFLAINTLICVWEISLGSQIAEIEQRHRDPGARREELVELFALRVAARELFRARLWARVWSYYALYDPSYADRRSFGFAIDVGNGWSTLLPGLLFLAGMTAGFLSPVALGILGALIFYQKLYGTCLYLFTFVFNRRHEGHRLAHVLALVGGTNSIWLLFPAIGLYVSIRLIVENRFELIWS